MYADDRAIAPLAGLEQQPPLALLVTPWAVCVTERSLRCVLPGPVKPSRVRGAQASACVVEERVGVGDSDDGCHCKGRPPRQGWPARSTGYAAL